MSVAIGKKIIASAPNSSGVYVPVTRKVNNKALNTDITLTASDVGALASDGTATKATSDADGNVITTTYKTKTESANVIITQSSSSAPSDTSALWVYPS